MFSALWKRGRLTALRSILALAFVTCSAGLAQAQAPAIDGNGDDLIAYAQTLAGRDCGLAFDDARDDISIADPKIVVCSAFEDTDGNAVNDYFVNGFDLRRFVFAYDRAGQKLYLLWRTEGFIADTDGNGNPDNNLCPPTLPTFADEPGIGSQENYQVRIDTDCNGAPDIIITVGGQLTPDAITVQGTAAGGTALAYRAGGGASGKDLEVSISGISLPEVFRVRGNSNASFDGLGEDITSELSCNPNPAIDVTKTVNVAQICPGGTADFTVTVTNTGNVGLTNVTVLDQLPAGLTYQQTVSNTCGGAVTPSGQQITYGPFSLASGASCQIVIRVGRTAECAGEQVNNVSVQGTFQSPCFNNNEPTVVSDKDSESVLCGNVVCSISAPDTRVCPGETVQICGPEGNYSYLWNNGAVTRCINVGAGVYSLVITDLATGCASTNPCAVTIVEDPRPVCSISAPDTQICPGETVQICGPEGAYTYLWNTGSTDRCIIVGAGTYSLVITSTVTGCVSNNSCTVTITENPRPICSISADKDAVCGTETAQLCGPEGPYTYLWNNGAVTRCINVGAGTYSLVITNTVTGCVSNNECVKTIIARTPPCVEVVIDPIDAFCVGEAFELCGSVRNCGTEVADLSVTYGGVTRSFDDVPAGESRRWCIPAVMPACVEGAANFTVNATATNDCGPANSSDSESINCKQPQIDVEKVAQETSVAHLGTIHYTITVRNPSATVGLEDVIVTDDLCAYAVWTGVSNPAPTSAPAVGSAGGIVTWNIGDIAPGGQVVITFEVTANVTAGGGVCPTTVQCENVVEASGRCDGGSVDSPRVRDEDRITTPITCAGNNCPRTVGYWGSQVAQRGNGSTKYTLAQVTQIAECIDNRSAYFDWPAGTDFEQFKRALSTSGMTQRKQAERQFAGVLANLCVDALNINPSQGGNVYLDPSTPISCGGLNADTIGELIDEVDAILAELAGQSLNDPAVKTRYGQLISCLDGINNGVNIPTNCGASTAQSSEDAEIGDDASAVDAALSVELYRPYPNPFAGATEFAYQVDGSDAPVDITVYDVAGRQVRKLVSGVQAAGRHTARWDGKTDSGVKATRGVYFVRTVIAGAKANTNRVLYLAE